MTASLLVIAALSLALPLLLLRGRTLRLVLALHAGAWLVFPALMHVIGVDPFLALATFAVILLAIVSLAIAFGRDVRWSATRAALAALLVYAAMTMPMTRTPIDGDEPYYLLITESLVRDHDVDLANQYRDLAHSQTGRTDLQPQLEDPTGPHGEQYSRHELFLPLLMAPGYALGGLLGALLTIALFGALLVRSTVRLMEDEGIDDGTIRLVFPFVAFAPPLLFFSARIWPEVPAAWLFVEAVRGLRQRRIKRWLPPLFAFVLLKLRFLLVAAVVVVRAVASQRRSRRTYALLAAMFVVPLAIVYAVSGSATNVHHWWEILPGTPLASLRGLCGLLVDGADGLLFQAPFYLFGVFALARWRAMPAGFRLGMSSSLLYLLYLVPRPEWYGGWAPPLRYIVFLMPFLALGAASLLRGMRAETRAAWLAPIAVWTAGITIHGLAYPWRLFLIANGESAFGAWLSEEYHADFTRLVPSLIRTNVAAIVASLLVLTALLLFAFTKRRLVSPPLVAPLLALLLAIGFVQGRKPGARIDFEDASVEHDGGFLYPELYTVARFAYRGGWLLRPGDSMRFLAKRGRSTLWFRSESGATIELGGHAYQLPATGKDAYGHAEVELEHGGLTMLRGLAGVVNLDRMEHHR